MPEYNEIASALCDFASSIYTVEEIIDVIGCDKERAEEILNVINKLRGF